MPTVSEGQNNCYRVTVHDENVGPVVAESSDSISEEATPSDTREAERLIFSRTVFRIMASITR